jgi:hypothetical protein
MTSMQIVMLSPLMLVLSYFFPIGASLPYRHLKRVPPVVVYRQVRSSTSFIHRFEPESLSRAFLFV